MSEKAPTKLEIIGYGIRLSICAAAIATVLFLILYFVRDEIYKDMWQTLTGENDLVFAVTVVSWGLIIPITFVVLSITSILAGMVMTRSLRTLLISESLSVISGVLIGILVGGFFGIVIGQLGEWLSQSTIYMIRSIHGISNGLLIGISVGAWYGWKMTRWLRRDQSSLSNAR